MWTLLAWGGRIGLLTSDEGLGSWLRIGGSLVVGLASAAALVIPQMEPARKPLLIGFAVWTVVLWVRSLLVNWMGSGSLPFKLVHTGLAIGFFVLAVLAFGTATRSNAVSGPDQGHGQQQGQSESTGLAEG